ncbi:unnamed protein product, partial [Owenia fusiformis]
RRLAAKLIEDFHSGELTLELITELIPEDLRKEYNETYVQVTLTIDGELVQQCLSQDQGVQDQDDGSSDKDGGASASTIDQKLTCISTNLEKLSLSKVKIKGQLEETRDKDDTTKDVAVREATDVETSEIPSKNQSKDEAVLNADGKRTSQWQNIKAIDIAGEDMYGDQLEGAVGGFRPDVA